MDLAKEAPSENQNSVDSYEVMNSVILSPTYDILLTLETDQLNKLFQMKNLQPTQMKQIAFSCPPDAALLVIDFQQDFICGSLRTSKCPAGQDGLSIMTNINLLLRMQFQKIYFTVDWHPLDHCSFYDNRWSLKLSPKSNITSIENVRLYDTVFITGPNKIEREQKLWPIHCVADTEGARIHSDLKLPESYQIIKKGKIPTVESYSAFGDPHGLEDTGLHFLLQDAGIKTVILCGIAFDVCVACTALDAIERGYQVVVVQDATVGIKNEAIKKKREELLKAGVYITQTNNIPGYLSGQYVPLQHIITAIRRSETLLTN